MNFRSESTKEGNMHKTKQYSKESIIGDATEFKTGQTDENVSARLVMVGTSNNIFEYIHS